MVCCDATSAPVAAPRPRSPCGRRGPRTRPGPRGIDVDIKQKCRGGGACPWRKGPWRVGQTPQTGGGSSQASSSSSAPGLEEGSAQLIATDNKRGEELGVEAPTAPARGRPPPPWPNEKDSGTSPPHGGAVGGRRGALGGESFEHPDPGEANAQSLFHAGFLGEGEALGF